MKWWAPFFVISLAVAGLTSARAVAEEYPSIRLKPATVKKIFRLVTGQPELKDDEIGLSSDADLTWTCVWTRDSDKEVVVLQVRDSDGAYRQPDITDISSLRFGMRLDLRDRIATLVRADRKKSKPE